MTVTPKQAVDAANEAFGRHPHYRALHAKGTLCRGSFTATPQAAALTRAPHMQGDPVPALVRVSNGAGNPKLPDYAPDVRGLAVKFELPDGTRTDIVSQTLPYFPFHDSDGFVEFVRVQRRTPAMAWRFPAYLLTHPRMIGALRADMPALRAPESYVTLRYYGIHAFRFVDRDGAARYVRYTWVPEAGDHRLSAREARARGRDYLRERLRSDLERGAARFTLELQIAAPGDPVDDPSKPWPPERERVDAGMLEIVAIDDETDQNTLVFDPARVIDGVELSGDPVLQFRPKAYSESVERRMAD